MWCQYCDLLKQSQKYGGSILGFLKNMFKNIEVQILDVWNMFKAIQSKSCVFEIISKTWGHNLGYLEYSEKYGSWNLGFLIFVGK